MLIQFGFVVDNYSLLCTSVYVTVYKRHHQQQKECSYPITLNVLLIRKEFLKLIKLAHIKTQHISLISLAFFVMIHCK